MITTHWRKPKSLVFKNIVKSIVAKIPTARVSVVEEPKTIFNAHPTKFHYYGESSQSKKCVSNLKVDINVIACDENIDTVFTNIGMASNCHLELCDYTDNFDSDSNTSVVSALETVHVDVHKSCM